jgi:hypothetical protein
MRGFSSPRAGYLAVRRKGARMYIGVGTILLIVVIILLIMFVF